MSTVHFIRDPSNRLDVVAGLIDGILNALTLAAGRLVHAGGEGATLSLALRVSVAAGATTIFVFFIAHYAQLRLDLVRHERQLNFTQARQARRDAPRTQGISGVAFKGDARIRLQRGRGAISSDSLRDRAVPSMVGFGDYNPRLERTRRLLARTIYGSPLLWGAGHFVAGIVFALVGMQLDLVG
jgi:hypothetical protein